MRNGQGGRPPAPTTLALICLAAMAATVVLSAYLRLAQAGLGCADWPACYAQALRDAAAGALRPAAGATAAAARLAHRVLATIVLAGALAMLFLTLRAGGRRARGAAAALLALALALAALGIVTPGARAPAVTLGNLLGGFAMLALCARLAAGPRDPALPGLGGWGWAGIAVLTLQIALGAQVGATYAGLSCPGLGECLRNAAGGDWQALSPWRAPVADAGGALHRSAAPVLLAHELGALVALAVIALLGALAWRRRRRVGAVALYVLAAAQAALGPLVQAAGLPLAGVLLHNAIAAALLTTLVLLR